MKKLFIFSLFLGFIFNSFTFNSSRDFDIKIICKGSKNIEGNLKVKEDNGIVYCPAEEFGEMLEINVFSESEKKKVVLYMDGRQVKLTADNPYIMIDNNVLQMVVEAREFDGRIYVPLSVFADILNRFLPGDYVYDERNRIFEINSSGSVNLLGLSIEEKLNGTLIRISSSRDFNNKVVHWIDEETNILYVTIYEGVLDSASMAQTKSAGIVRRVIPSQLPENAQIAFVLRNKIESRDISFESGTNDILIALQPLGARGAVQKSKDEILNSDKDNWVIDTIVLDPGHGGVDPGTIGRTGTKEKDINLAIAKRLGELIEKNLNVNVVYTRTTDKTVSLKQRTNIANSCKGKLFISIHANANRNRSVRGFETYFLRHGKNKAALNVLEVEQRENNVINAYDYNGEEFTEDDLVLLSMTQSAFVKESEQLAYQVSLGLDKALTFRNNGVRQAGFVVLWGVSMPNILIEVGYLSNRYEESRLKTRATQYKIAEGIYSGIENFVRNSRK